ncbi:uncharacterized protein SETTUDRAFT_23375 [Exserohilum turcica Et28A]|uniref:Uncharacterized protein n=1 Tax=Exserohilum turcicum (strain 28A) TaxID=671987 RepID=R0K167_EXST2|nr:uncharacterized protein SETTUDRAFT_23375 [Exserohilum turcica Et28A]EOA82132.1 hypothetical protein SETTUDRAFT_23375 [Exserohilum turcica Et28A]
MVTVLAAVNRRHHDLEQLFELLKSLPYEDAAETLGRIRAGVEPRDIVETITHGSMLMQFASKFRDTKTGTSSSIDKSEASSGSESGNGMEIEETESGTASRSSEEPKHSLDAAQRTRTHEKSTAIPLDRILISDPEDD